MISFAFTEEQKDFRLTLERFAHDTLLPGYRDRASSTDFPWDVQRRLASMGVLGIGLPEECGGSGAEDPILLGLATEALAEGDVNVASAPVQVVGGLNVAQAKNLARAGLRAFVISGNLGQPDTVTRYNLSPVEIERVIAGFIPEVSRV